MFDVPGRGRTRLVSLRLGRTGGGVLRLACCATALLLGSAPAALADDSASLTDANALSAWSLTPDIVIATALVLAIYLNGWRQRVTASRRTPLGRHLLFLGGIGCVFVALQSPLDAIADRLFFVHQIQHLFLRMLGPMLIALSWPEALLSAGVPRPLRRAILTPIASNPGVRQVFSVLGHPAVATLVFIAALYVWEIPRIHDVAILNDGVHYVMHVTMLIAGLLFWWLIFDRRSPKAPFDMDDHDHPWWRLLGRASPHGLRFGVRIMMLWIVILSNIVLGAVTAFKSVELYPAYDTPGRLFGFSAMADEQVGGFIIWMPSSMMCVLAVLLVLHRMGLFETELDIRRRSGAGSNAAALFYPRTGAELIARARPRNRMMALAFSAFVVFVFATALMVGALDFASHNGGLWALEPSGGVRALAHVQPDDHRS